MQVIITLAGLGQRFQNQNYKEPKPIVPVMGKPALSYLIGSMASHWKLIFALGEHLRDSSVEAEILRLRPEAKVIYVPHSDRGPIDTVLAALPYVVDNEDSVAVSYCDYAMIWNAKNFEKFVVNSQCDVSIVSYRGFHPTYLGPNTYAHLQVDEDTKQVLRIKEKSLFGNHIEDEWTSTGFYYFRSVELLKIGLQLQLEKNLKHGKEFYTSLAIQALIDQAHDLKSSQLSVLNYPISHFMQMGTPEDVQHIEKWYRDIVVENKKSQFEAGSLDEKLFNYWKYVFRSLVRSR